MVYDVMVINKMQQIYDRRATVSKHNAKNGKHNAKKLWFWDGKSFSTGFSIKKNFIFTPNNCSVSTPALLELSVPYYMILVSVRAKISFAH